MKWKRQEKNDVSIKIKELDIRFLWPRLQKRKCLQKSVIFQHGCPSATITCNLFALPSSVWQYKDVLP